MSRARGSQMTSHTSIIGHGRRKRGGFRWEQHGAPLDAFSRLACQSELELAFNITVFLECLSAPPAAPRALHETCKTKTKESDLQQQKEPASRAKATSKYWWTLARVRASPPLPRRRTACRVALPGGCRDRRLNPLAARSALLVFDFRWRFEDHRVDCVDGPALPIHLRPDGLEDHLLPREGPLALREIGSGSGHSSSDISKPERDWRRASNFGDTHSIVMCEPFGSSYAPMTLTLVGSSAASSAAVQRSTT